MKRTLTTILTLFVLAFATNAQQNIKHASFTLPNGLRVMLAEEHSEPKVFGGILVHAGSKNEDPNITGVAHYFEHMMFKGTDRIGTINWAAESLYLDSISAQYDKLHATSDETERKAIQREINRLNIAATKYAIPNEVDAILSKIGSTGVNAGTSYDYTVYYNAFPSNQMENWMDIYVERFRYPVFRLFQSELEAVYEEKNMYEDSPIYAFQRQMFKECFGEHPYSRDVIGLGEHLKNPQPSEMRRFFDTYYVANNMVLVLVGDFDIESIKPMIENKFGSMRQGVLPESPNYKLPTFEKRTIKEVKMTPIPLGMIVFPGVPAGHPDEIPLQVLSSIISGGAGIMDRAASQGRIMMASYTCGSLEDAGINLVMYAPNLLKQSHAEAENVIWGCLDSIKNGFFSDELLEAIKTTALLERELQTEDIDGMASLFQELGLQGKSFEQWESDNERLQKLTREDIIAIAQKYFDPDHCTIVRSKMGFPAKDAVAKPDWEHLDAQNIGAQSEFAKDIYSRHVESVRPQNIIFGKDVRITPINSHFDLYSTPNPKNKIFSLAISYDYGTIDDSDLDRAAAYFDLIGANNMDHEDFTLQLQRLGATFSVNVENTSTTLNIMGYDYNLPEILKLVRAKFDQPRHDDKQIKLIVDGIKADAKTSKSDAGTWFSALARYVRFGQQSEYLRHTPVKEWQKNATGEKLMQQFQSIFLHSGHVNYVGNLDDKQVINELLNYDLIPSNAKDMPNRDYKDQLPADNQVFYIHNKKFGQSNIQIYLPSVEVDESDKAICEVFNEYYGAGGMNSLIFQEIREFRSLGYSTYGVFQSDPLHINGGKLITYLGTQSDKTLDGLQALDTLMTTIPIRTDKFQIARDYKVLQRNGSYINFRSMPANVYYWRHVMGYKEDPRAAITNQIPTITEAELQRFIDKYISKRAKTYIISGNAKRFKAKELEKFGKVTQFKQKDIMRY